MTMSVGLGKIIQDPTASIIVRKALGALTTPGLLVHDTGLSIDGHGRIIIKLNPDGALTQDEDGLSFSAAGVTEAFVGIDSHVDLISDVSDKEWNARLTGTAPNFIEGSIAVGTEDLDGIAPAIEALCGCLDHPKVNITATRTQLRLNHDSRNFLSQRVSATGLAEFFSIGTEDPGYHFASGDGTQAGIAGGVRINWGTTVTQIFAFYADITWAGGGTVGSTSWVEFNFDTTTITSPGPFYVSPNQDHVTVSSYDASIPAMWISWNSYVSAFNIVTVRVAWFDVWPADTHRFLFLVHKLFGG